MSSETKINVKCRAATPDDAKHVAYIHDESRRYAYKNIVSEEFLNAMTLDERTTFWRNRIVTGGDNDVRVFVAQTGDTVCGFIAVETKRKRNAGEIDRIYVLSTHLRQGIGKELMLHALDHLRDFGFEKAMLWTFAENGNAHLFYDKLGFRADGAQRKLPGVPKEIRFVLRLEPW